MSTRPANAHNVAKKKWEACHISSSLGDLPCCGPTGHPRRQPLCFCTAQPAAYERWIRVPTNLQSCLNQHHFLLWLVLGQHSEMCVMQWQHRMTKHASLSCSLFRPILAFPSGLQSLVLYFASASVFRSPQTDKNVPFITASPGVEASDKHMQITAKANGPTRGAGQDVVILCGRQEGSSGRP